MQFIDKTGLALAENKLSNAFLLKHRSYALFFATLILICWVLRSYFIPSLQVILGALATPLVFKIKEKGVFSYRYGYAAIVLIVLYYHLHTGLFLFFACGCLALCTIECQWGKIGTLPLLLLLFISPALHYAVNVTTFSLRLTLSEYAATMLNWIGMKVQNSGSYFTLPDGSIFNVDTACIGLNMFNTGLCLSILFVGFNEQKTTKQLGILPLTGIIALTAALLVLTNLLRIIALVFFKSAPGTISHDLIGIASLLIYTVAPIYITIRWLTNKYGRIFKVLQPGPIKIPFRKNLLIISAISVLLTTSFVKVTHYKRIEVKDYKPMQLQLPGFNKQIKEDGVAEFKKESILIYIKPAARPFESDHPPAMCWQGAGFHLENIEVKELSKFSILKATLRKGKATQYTAWWYDNGEDKTIEQWKWRLSKNEPYRIINITTANKNELDALCNEYLKKKLF